MKTRNSEAAMTTGVVAKLCCVSHSTVNKWCDRALIPSYRVPGTKHRRILREDLIHFLKQHGMPTGEVEKA